MSILKSIFSSCASTLVKSVGGVIDNLHTSKEEKLEAEQKIKELVASYEVQMEKEISSRWEADMKIGKLAYEDDSITYNGESFPRMDIDGIDSILVDGKWKEAGDTGFPWENDANNGNN